MKMKTELNEYLFDEFGVEGDRTQLSEAWPFVLSETAVVDGEHYFEFEADGDRYYAIYGSSIRMRKKEGSLSDMKLQERGAKWIGSRGPVDLNTSRGEHPVVPLIPQRRARIEELAQQVRSGTPVKILEGLFLERTREHLALIEFAGEDFVHVVGDHVCITGIPKSSLSAWMILSRAIGHYIEKTQTG